MEFTVELSEHEGRTVLRCAGELDAHGAPTLAEALAPLTSVAGCSPIVDLTGVDFLDSTGLGVLVTGMKHVRDVGGTLDVIACTPRVLRVFELTGLDSVLTLHATLDSALTG